MSCCEMKEGVAVQEIDPRLFGRLPSLKSEAERFNSSGGGEGAPQKVVRHGLQGPSLFGGLFLEFAENLIIDRQGGSSHMQKHLTLASRCQTRLSAPEGELA